MKLFKRTQPSAAPPRQVNMLGRTMPYAYHARRSTEAGVVGRQLLRSAVGVRQAKRAAHYWRQRFGLLLVLIAIAIAAANLLTLDTVPTVRPATTAPRTAFLHPLDTYQGAAEKLLAGSLLNRNKITVDANTITTRLRRQFPELTVVSMTLPLFGRHPVIYIAQSDPALLLTASDGRQYIVDTEGRAIAQATSSSLSSQLLPVRDESGASVRVGQLVTPSTTVTFIRDFNFQLAQRQEHIETFVLPPASSELDVYLANQRYFIRCNLASGTVLQQAGTFLAAQQYFEGRGITPGHYVDVRLDGRAYYR